MNGIQLSRLAGAGSAALLLAALGFQIIGYAPCELCVLQRWPHVVAVIIALAVVLTGRVRILAILGALAVATSMAIAIYHSGVEIGWWEGPATCSPGTISVIEMSPQQLLEKLQSAPVVRCDEVAWRFLGLSMATWNAICSALLAGIWLLAARRAR